jgi:hypothetical protein
MSDHMVHFESLNSSGKLSVVRKELQEVKKDITNFNEKLLEILGILHNHPEYKDIFQK